MKPLTNKGQVLVAFILLLPIFLFLCAIMIDFGLISIQKRKIVNTVNDALAYAKTEKGNENLEEELNSMLRKTIANVEQIEISTGEETVEIHIKSSINSGFKNLFDDEIYEIDITKIIAYEE